jgi:type I restriction enzyme M protein
LHRTGESARGTSPSQADAETMIDDLKKTLWATADKLRANMDAAE